MDELPEEFQPITPSIAGQALTDNQSIRNLAARPLPRVTADTASLPTAVSDKLEMCALNTDLRVSPKTVQQSAVEKLKDAIMSGVFKPGDRLIESTLCVSLGISRPSLREALRSLEAERLIEIVPNRGPQVPMLSWKAAEEIYDVRALLEGEAASRCATTISTQEIAALSLALNAFRKATKTKDPAGRVRATADFYRIILRSCGNEIIEQLLESLLARINFLRARSMSLSGRAERSYEELNSLFLAIKQGDADKARKMAIAHVTHARDAAKRSFDAAPAVRVSAN